MRAPIYLDYNATTPCDPRVVQAMLPYLSDHFGNPHSRNHSFGWNAEDAVEQARTDIASAIHAQPKDIIFTSGATEANNLALKGVAHFREKGHIVTIQTEHKCVLESLRILEQEGFKITMLPVEKTGLVNLDVLEKALTPDVFMVSIAAVNSEIGVIQPLRDIGRLCREKSIYFHTDAAQALGKIPLDVEDMCIDLMSLSGHKIYGPKGIGALYVRRRNPRVRLRPLFHGGGQERGLRAGTVPPFLCVGFAHATQLALEEMDTEQARLLALRERFYHRITTELENVTLNGAWEPRIAGNLNLSFFGVEGEGLMMAIQDLALSSGSACTSASLEPSYVLRALGVPEDLAHTSLRITFGRPTTQEDVDYACTRIIESVQRLRALSPLWDMYKEGIDIQSVQWIAH
jgi:cysteine desulfurase